MTVLRVRRIVRNSPALGRLGLGDHALDPVPGACQQLGGSIIEIGHDARIEDGASFRWAHLLEFRSGPDL